MSQKGCAAHAQRETEELSWVISTFGQAAWEPQWSVLPANTFSHLYENTTYPVDWQFHNMWPVTWDDPEIEMISQSQLQGEYLD